MTTVTLNVGGRPRKYDRDEIERKMLEWALLDDSFNLNGFCAKNLVPPLQLIKWAKEDPDGFGISYDIVKSFLGERRERGLKEGKVHIKAYDLNAATYDKFLKEEKRDEALFLSKLKAEENKALNDEDVERHNQLMTQLSVLQSEFSSTQPKQESINTSSESIS